jgi:hypothetical protein
MVGGRTGEEEESSMARLWRRERERQSQEILVGVLMGLGCTSRLG